MTWIHDRKKIGWYYQTVLIPLPFVSQKCKFFIKNCFPTLCAQRVNLVYMRFIIYINANTLDTHYKKFIQYCLAGLLSFAFVSEEKVQLLLTKWLSTLCTQRVNVASRHFIIFLMEMPWKHITRSYRQYYLAVSLPFAFVLQKGYNFYKRNCFQHSVHKELIWWLYAFIIFVMLMHWTQNIGSFRKFQHVVLLLFPYVFRKVYSFY